MVKKRILLGGASALMILLLILCISGSLAAGAKWPSGSSKGQKSDSKLRVDTTNLSEGYFMAKVGSKCKNRLKLRVVFGKETLTYDLNTSGDWEVFPLQFGSGKYEISLWENVSGKKYSSAGKISVKASLSREDGAFLYPNQYVNYTEKTEAVAMADKLCKGKNEKESFEAITKFMTSSFVYDFVKAATVKAGVLPDIEGCYKKKMGVCQDLSAIMVCMLRSQGIPARLIIGYADKGYHAWTVTEIGGKDVFFDPTAALNAISKPKKYTVERYY